VLSAEKQIVTKGQSVLVKHNAFSHPPS